MFTISSQFHERKRITRKGLLPVLVLFLFLAIEESSAQEPVSLVIGESSIGRVAEFSASGSTLLRLIFEGDEDDDRFEERAENIARRLNDFFLSRPRAAEVRVAPSGRGVVITLKGKYLLQVTPQQARLHRSSAGSLASLWAGRLKNLAREFESMRLFPTVQQIPLGEERYIRILGSAGREISLEGYSPEIIQCEFEPSGMTVRVRGVGVGKTALHVRSGAVGLVARISVKELAGSVPETLEIEVSGNPATAEVLQEAILQNLSLACRIKEGTSLRVEQDALKRLRSLKPGDSTEIDLTVRLAGPDYLPVVKSVAVMISNLDRPLPEVSRVILSNRPEVISSSGTLLLTRLKSSGAARFLFHHRGGGGMERVLVASLRNDSDSECSVFLVPALVGPCADEIYTGHLATSRYFTLWRARRGVVARVPAGRELILQRWRIKPGEVVSGLALLEVVDGSAPLLQVCVEGDHPPDVSLQPAAASTAKGTFEPAVIELKKTHVVGKGYTFIYVGDEPYVREVDTKEPNIGNYGILYRIELEVENLWDESKEVKLYFVSGGGPARGNILLEGRHIETPLACHLGEALLATFALAPKEKRNLEILTLPQAGSNYPVRLVVKSDIIKGDGDEYPFTQK